MKSTRDAVQRHSELEQLNHELEARVAQRTSELAVANVELQRISQLQQAILNSANYVIVSTDAQGVVRTFNAAAERMLGYAAEEVIGRVTPVLFHDAGEVAERAHMLATTGQSVVSPFDALVAGARAEFANERETILVRRDGSRFPALLSVSPLRDAAGATVGFLGIASDISARKQVEAVLRTSEEQYRTLVDHSLQGVVIFQDGRIVFANAAMAAITGYTVEELLELAPKAVMRMVHAEDRPTVFPSVDAAADQHEARRLLQMRFVHRDGSIRWVMSAAMPVIYRGKPARQAVLIDITELKQTEKSLLESTRFVEQITETTSTFIFVYDLEERRDIYLNPAAQRLLGYDLAELAALGDGVFAAIVHPDDLPAVNAKIAQYGELQDHETIEQEVRVLDATGEWHWLLMRESVFKREPGGRPMQILGVSMDITALKRSERALQESEERFRLIAEHSTDLIFVYDPDGTIVYASPSVQSLLGFDAQELIGERAKAYLHPADADELLQRVYRPLMEGQRAVATMEHRIRHSNGEYVWVETHMNAIMGENGAIYRLIASARDITERKRTEQALRNALEKERELSELRSRLVTMASHEFRTPLATILAATETLLAYRDKMDARQTELRLERIRSQVQHLSQIIEDVMSMTHAQSGRVPVKRELTELAAFCREIVEEFQSRSDIGQPIVYQFRDVPLHAAVDRKLMRTVITNLLSNAVKYSPNDRQIDVWTRRLGSTIQIEVTDRGIGIPEADQEHLYETFYRASNVGTTAGTGLGLAIAKEFVEYHDGQIAFVSRPGAGTSFFVNIPAEH